ncbi:galactosyltransferase or lps biosynthesis rfbu related protein [Lunatimonas lonarensis]|uniref:Galactosyltransferase or lps biosynthesis rfbu related protein n=2 Tax=Lunatimonas lonarensis TaxID=1232681 RepID=R7ZWR3_9BACT|nr:galactosyltransferase or lps biosynthesis rfbu related protein [Lunatimonas lonarensis]
MHLPHINYGNYRKKWLRKASIFSFKNCALIVPVSEALVASDYRYDSAAPEKQGLKNLIPGLATPIQVIHNGFDAAFWNDPGNARKHFSFLTVATGITASNRAKVKGIDLILEAAHRFKHFHFTLVGDDRFSTALPNVTIAPAMDKESLRLAYQQSQFYLQLSASEGFPNALAEAMLCGCVPIGSKVGEIAHIIGNTGFILEKRDFGLLCTIFDNLATDKTLAEKRRQARDRITTHFSYSLRKEKLLGIIDQSK